MKEATVLFAAETWARLGDNLYVSVRRQNTKNKNERQKLEQEIEQARILAGRGHTIYFVPETGAGKHYDALVDGVPTELKHIVGGKNAIKKRFTESRRQAQNVFLLIENKALSIQEIRNALRGELAKHNYKGGCVYIYIDELLIQ